MSVALMRTFLYGTLRDAELRRIVLGERVEAESALLPGFAVRSARDGDWPTIVEDSRAEAPGLLAPPLGEAAAARLDWYERAFGYRPETVRVGDADACVYRGEDDASAGAWDFDAWRGRWADLSRRAAAETMGHYPARSAEWVAARWPQIRQRAASAATAGETETPMDVRSGLAGGDVQVIAERRPYTDYFSLIEQDLRFGRFGGGMSAPVSRTALIAGDAATVLPFDPAADTVLLVEQFRFGPWARGDLRPWTLEPIAGRIDAGETAEETATREAREEAGLQVERLEKVAAFYPTTGAMSEYVHAFVGLCDLSGQSGTVAGAEAEDEDILSHVVPFERLMELVTSGEAENGPLLVSAYWLAAHRDRLRNG